MKILIMHYYVNWNAENNTTMRYVNECRPKLIMIIAAAVKAGRLENK